MSSSSPSASAATERKYRDVRRRKWGKWVSEIRLPHSRERIWLRSYDTPEKAARAFDAAFVCLRGAGADGAGINFPDSPPAVARTTSDPQEVYAAAVSHANRWSSSARAPPPASALPREEAHVVVEKPDDDVSGRNAVVPPMQVPEARSFDWSQNPVYSSTSHDLWMWMTTTETAVKESKEEDEGTSDKLWSFQDPQTPPT